MAPFLLSSLSRIRFMTRSPGTVVTLQSQVTWRDSTARPRQKRARLACFIAVVSTGDARCAFLAAFKPSSRPNFIKRDPFAESFLPRCAVLLIRLRLRPTRVPSLRSGLAINQLFVGGARCEELAGPTRGARRFRPVTGCLRRMKKDEA